MIRKNNLLPLLFLIAPLILSGEEQSNTNSTPGSKTFIGKEWNREQEILNGNSGKKGTGLVTINNDQQQLNQQDKGKRKKKKEDPYKTKKAQEKLTKTLESYELSKNSELKNNIILTDFMKPFPSINQDEQILKGRLTDSKTNLPVGYAEISDNRKSIFLRSNSKGEFQLSSFQFPALLKINKLGYKEESVEVRSPQALLSVSLTPLEITHNSDQRIRLKYAALVKKAAEKLKADPVSSQNDNTHLVYCRISALVDSTIKSLFESYAYMDVTKSSLQGFQSNVSRYAPPGERITGVSGNRLAYNLDAFTRMPPLSYLERFVKNQGSFEQDGNRIAIASLKTGDADTYYYIRLADTSIVQIKRQYKSEKQNKINGQEQIKIGNKNNSTEISFSPSHVNRKNLEIDFIADHESFQLIRKGQRGQSVSKTTLYCVIPDSAQINERIKDYRFKESLTRPNQQLNFNAAYSLSRKGSLFDGETQKLLIKPYSSSFWLQNSLIVPDPAEQKEIARLEQKGRFYSDDRLSPGDKINDVEYVATKLNKTIIPVENVYIESDRSEYFAGDTIWFSAFVLDNLSMDSTYLSKVLYVDLIDPENKPEKHLKLFIKNGRAKGDFAINKESKNGIFRIRAYTQWMRNFQNEYLFEREIPVYRSNIENLIAVNPIVTKEVQGDSVSLFINVLLPPGYRSIERQLELNIRLNDSISINEKIPFKGNYSEAFNFYVPSSYQCSFADVKLTLSDTAFISEQRIAIPIKSGTDLQFFPESGKMIAGINSVIAFKATDKKGNPVEIEADIEDENQKKVAHIKVDKSGVGKFRLIPEANKIYKAVVNSENGKYIFPLPVIEPKGYVITFNPESYSITIKNNLNPNGKHHLLVSVRGAVYNALELNLESGDLLIGLPFKKYPKGIVQITLTDSLYRPLAERLVFNNKPDQKLQLRVETDKREYNKRGKVNLSVKATDSKGKPVESTFSVAVIDASKTDSIKSFTDIESYLYLTSELKGKIDYNLISLSDTTIKSKINRDLVMMTQGWRNYLWNSIRYNNTIKEHYPNEKNFFVTGNIFNYNRERPSGYYRLNSFEKSTGFNDIIDVNERGEFRIEFPYFYDTHELFIQNRNIKGKIDDVRFTLDTVPPPAINFKNNELPYTSYKLGFLKVIEEKITENDSLKRLRHINLPEVTVTAKKPRRNLTPDKDIDLNKEDPTGKKYGSLMQMIMEQFGEKANGPLVLIINGNPYYIHGETAEELAKNAALFRWAMSRPVNEFSNVEFYNAGSDMSLSFGASLTPFSARLGGPHIISFRPVVSLTSYADSYRGVPKGAVILPFQGFYQAKEFYQPNYELYKTEKPDYRPTIYWNPEIKTDSTGRAKVSFYNSDLKGEAVIKVTGVSYQLKDATSTTSHYKSR